MSQFQIRGLSELTFAPLFELSDKELEVRKVRRIITSKAEGYPCRVSMREPAIGEEVLLLSYEHQPAHSPYRASGPIFVRKAGRQAILPPGEIPDIVSRRLMSVRGYDGHGMIVDADVCEGSEIVSVIHGIFAHEQIKYLHLHNAKRGCYSCLVTRA